MRSLENILRLTIIALTVVYLNVFVENRRHERLCNTNRYARALLRYNKKIFKKNPRKRLLIIMLWHYIIIKSRIRTIKLQTRRQTTLDHNNYNIIWSKQITNDSWYNMDIKMSCAKRLYCIIMPRERQRTSADLFDTWRCDIILYKAPLYNIL